MGTSSSSAENFSFVSSPLVRGSDTPPQFQRAEHPLSDRTSGGYFRHQSRCLNNPPTGILVKLKRSLDCAEPEKQCTILMQDFDRLLGDAKFSDFVIETENGTRIPVHRNVLSARSPVFSVMLDTDMAEKNSGYLKIDDFSTQTVKDMINYLYTGRIPVLSLETASELLKVAEKYDLKSLKNICGENLKKHLAVENAIQILQIADMYQEESLKTSALQFISENGHAFSDRQVFDTHLKQNPTLLIDVIECLTKCKQREETFDDLFHNT